MKGAPQVSSAGDGDGGQADPPGRAEKPKLGRDAFRVKRSTVVMWAVRLFADDLSDWIIHIGKEVLEALDNTL